MAVFGKHVDPEIAESSELYHSMLSMDASRLSRYDQYRSEIEKTRLQSRSSPPVPTEDYGHRMLNGKPRRHNINLPFAQAVTVKHAHRVAGRLPDVIVDRRDESAEERYRSNTMEKMVWGIVRNSAGETQFADGAWDASQVGSACFDAWMNYETQIPQFRCVDPAGILVVAGVDDPHKYERVFRFWKAPARAVRYEYRNKSFRGKPIPTDDIQAQGEQDMVTIVQECDNNRLLRYVADSNVGLYEIEHGYGFVPYVVIPNLGPERALWGWSDYEFIRDLQEYLPVLYSRQADVIRAVAGGSYHATGTGKDGKEIERVIQEGGVLTTKREGEIKPIEVPEIPPFLESHVGNSVEFLKMLGFVPDAAWGDGNAGSGSDRGLQLQPLLELTALKQIHWTAGLSRLFEMCFRMIEKKQTGNASYRGASVSSSSNRRSRFAFQLGPNLDPVEQPNPAFEDDLTGEENEFLVLPRNPKELLDGDYSVRFVFQNRIDPDDPAFVLSEVTKFERGVQSLETTLDRLGIQAPEDEMRRIEQEAERFPWLRQGQIALIKAQLDASQQGEGGGAPFDGAGATEDSLGMMLSPDGQALDADAGFNALPDSGGVPYGAA